MRFFIGLLMGIVFAGGVYLYLNPTAVEALKNRLGGDTVAPVEQPAADTSAVAALRDSCIRKTLLTVNATESKEARDGASRYCECFAKVADTYLPENLQLYYVCAFKGTTKAETTACVARYLNPFIDQFRNEKFVVVLKEKCGMG
jgi:hypothetical protein